MDNVGVCNFISDFLFICDMEMLFERCKEMGLERNCYCSWSCING